MTREQVLRRRLRGWLSVFIAGLFLSGATAIPLEAELDAAVKFIENHPAAAPAGAAKWIRKVREAVQDTYAEYPFMAYGTDWLAFGHFVIAIAFVGAWRDPVRNLWLFQFGMIACMLVVPYALVFGALRGIPMAWRLIDCSFGVIGIFPVWICWRGAKELEALDATARQQSPS